MKFIEGVGGNTIIADYREKKYGPSRRLKLAALTVLVIVALYLWIGVQVADGAGFFIPGDQTQTLYPVIHALSVNGGPERKYHATD